jgi:hypothetical protein
LCFAFPDAAEISALKAANSRCVGVDLSVEMGGEYPSRGPLGATTLP